MRNIRSLYHLGQPRNKLRGIDRWESRGKVNSTILYRNELDPEKQTITQELYGLKLPWDQLWKDYDTS